MFAIERQKEIKEILDKNGAVTVTRLVKKFEVSVETIRRDLLSMEKKNLLHRVHGGAVTAESMKPFSKLSERMSENEENKIELSEAAMSVISEGDIIAVDSGSTAVSFANVLKKHFSKLTVVTHSLDVFEILEGYKDFKVILCGGMFLESEKAFYGELTISMMKMICVNKSFIFPSAISLKSGICDYQYELHSMQRQVLEMAERVYILADSSKFERNAMLKVDDMKDEYIYITDAALPENLRKIYEENNLIVIAGKVQK